MGFLFPQKKKDYKQKTLFLFLFFEKKEKDSEKLKDGIEWWRRREKKNWKWKMHDWRALKWGIFLYFVIWTVSYRNCICQKNKRGNKRCLFCFISLIPFLISFFLMKLSYFIQSFIIFC